MKKQKMRILSLLLMALMVVMMTAPTAGIAAGQPTVGLGTTSTYAILAGTGITNTGPTIINGDAGGDVGSDPTGTFTGQDQVTISGAVHLADANSLKAKTDLVTAYNDAAGRTPVTRISSELGGQTLIPGTYDSADGTFQITGTLTLDAQGDPDGVFVFKTASTLITAADSNVSLLNGARYCRTFWQVGSSATLGTNSHFIGHIFALTSITANNGASVQGQLLARNGAVTLDTNTIMNGICAAAPAPTTTQDRTTAPTTTAPTTTAPTTTASTTTAPTTTAPTTTAPTTTSTTTTTTTTAPTTTSPTTIAPTTTSIVIPVTALPIEGVPLDTALAPVVETVSGGELPATASPWFNLLLAGAALTTVGIVGWRKNK